jgi:hypothetical protein
MHNYKNYFLGLSIFVLTGCQVTQGPEYLPGYYQPEQYHPARYEYSYYDYHGNYHASYMREAYEEPGRWHRAPVVSVDNINKSYYVESALAEEEATEALGDVVGEDATIEPNVK